MTELYDTAFVLSNFDVPSFKDECTAHETRRYDAEHPEAGANKIASEVALENLAYDRARLKRARDEQARADLVTEKQAGKRHVRLTVHGWVNYATAQAPSLAGVLVATTALSIYAADSGAIAALDNNWLGAFAMAFPVIAAAQATKAVGQMAKDDSAKRRYYGRLAKLAAVSFGIFVVGAALTFAPHPVDTAAIQDVLAHGAPPENAFFAACKAIAPYLTLGGGLIAEILAAAIISNRADAINALGRTTSQGITITQKVLDTHIAALQRKIETCARKAGRLQAETERHAAALAARIEAALAYGRQLKADYEAFAARSRAEFLTQRTQKDV